MNDDAQLLRSHVEQHSEAAFAELVQRHIGLVFATAVRRLGQDTHLAEDVTQCVFTDLARKASALRAHTSLAGWLYVSTQNASAAMVRREQRRKRRELVAQSMHISPTPTDPDPDYAQLRPLLDDAIVELKRDEREAVVLRFFEKRTFAEIGAALAVTEEAARKRVDRALDKLHAVLTRRGITSSALALSATLSNTGMAAVPAGLAGKVAGTALAEAATGGLFSLATISSAALPVAAAAVGAFVLFPLHQHNQATRAALATFSDPTAAIAELRVENRQLARTAVDATTLARAAAEVTALRAALAALPAPPPPITSSSAVTITPEGTIGWGEDREPITLSDFLSRLGALQRAAGNGESQLVIRARGTHYDQMLYALDEARKNGIKHIVVECDAMPEGKLPFTWF